MDDDGGDGDGDDDDGIDRATPQTARGESEYEERAALCGFEGGRGRRFHFQTRHMHERVDHFFFAKIAKKSVLKLVL